MPAALVPDVLVLFAFVLVPGAGLCLAGDVTRGRPHLTFLAMSFGIGFAGVALTCLALVLVGAFTPVPLAISWAVVTTAGWGIAIGRGSIGPHARAWRRWIAADPGAAAVSTLVIAGVAVARWTVAPVANIASTVLRYWADAVEIADAGRIPHDTLQWNRLLEPITNKIALNSFNGGVSLLLGREPMVPLAALLFVVTIGLFVIAIALCAELGIRRLAPVAALLLFANQVMGSELTADLGRNLAEDWGRLVALAAVLAAVLALRRRPSGEAGVDRPDRWRVDPAAVAAGVLLGTAAGTHLVAASFAVAFVIALASASLVVRGGVRTHLVRAGSVMAVAAALGAIVLIVPPGDLGLKGAAGSAEYRKILTELGLPPDFDPTRFIVTDSQAAAESTPPIDTGDVLDAFAYRVVGENVFDAEPGDELPPWLLIVPTGVAILLVLAVLRLGPWRLRVTVLAATILGILLLVAGIAFALRYDLFALAAFGNRRLFNYVALPYVLILTAAAESLLWRLRRRVPRSTVPVVALVLVVGVGALLIPKATWAQSERRDRLDQQLELLRWIGDHVPCEGRVLANRRTLGTFEAISGRAGVLEGMGPHVRPAVLGPAIRELFRARDFFLDPVAHAAYLDERGVAAVLITKPPNRFGGYAGLPRVGPHGMDDVRSLRRAYENDSGTVYLVAGFRPDPSLPTVRGRPGFGC